MIYYVRTINRYKRQLSTSWEENIDEVYLLSKKRMIESSKSFNEIKISKFLELKQKFINKYLWKRIYNYHVKLDEYFMARKLFPKKTDSMT